MGLSQCLALLITFLHTSVFSFLAMVSFLKVGLGSDFSFAKIDSVLQTVQLVGK